MSLRSHSGSWTDPVMFSELRHDPKYNVKLSTLGHSVLKEPNCLPGQIITAPLEKIMANGMTFTPVHNVRDEQASSETLSEYDIYQGKTSKKLSDNGVIFH